MTVDGIRLLCLPGFLFIYLYHSSASILSGILQFPHLHLQKHTSAVQAERQVKEIYMLDPCSKSLTPWQICAAKSIPKVRFAQRIPHHYYMHCHVLAGSIAHLSFYPGTGSVEAVCGLQCIGDMRQALLFCGRRHSGCIVLEIHIRQSRARHWRCCLCQKTAKANYAVCTGSWLHGQVECA